MDATLPQQAKMFPVVSTHDLQVVMEKSYSCTSPSVMEKPYHSIETHPMCKACFISLNLSAEFDNFKY